MQKKEQISSDTYVSAPDWAPHTTVIQDVLST